MLISRIVAFAAVLAALSSCEDSSPSAVAAEPADAPVWAHEASDLPADPAVRYGQLENGLRFAILENDTPTQIGALRLRIAAGSLMEADDQRGLAHMLEHMAFNGSANVPEGEMIRILERLGLEFGPDTNAYTSYDETVYMLDLPSTNAETLDGAFMLMGEIADDLLIDPEAVDRERGVVLSEMRVRNTYDYRYQVAAQEFLYEGARFPDRSPIGTEDVLRNAPAHRLRDFYEAYYRPERAVVVFVGDAPADEIETRIRETFGGWTSSVADGGDPDLGAPAERPLEAGLFIDPDMPTVATVSEARPAPEIEDTIAQRRERLVRSLGFAMLSRRLQGMARGADAPFISASVGYSRAFDTLESASLQVVSETGEWSEALVAGEIELRRAIEFGFSDSELAEQIADLRASFQAAADGADTRRTPGLADGLVGSISSDSVFTHPRTDLERFERIAAGITTDEIEAAFREAWSEDDPLLFLGSSEAIEGGAEAVTTAYLESVAAPVEAGEERDRGAFAYEDLGPVGEVVSRDVIEDLDITRVRFANNVRLNVKQTDFADDRISVSVRVGGGRLQMPKDLPGLEMLAESAFVSGGLVEHSLDDLQSLLAGRNVGLSFGTSEDAFDFSSVTTPQDFPLQLKLFAAYVAAPGYREEALTRYRRSLDSWYDSLDATPDGVQSAEVPRLLRSGDPRYGVPSKEDLEARTLQELAAVLAEPLASGAIEIAVVGDIGVEEAIAATAASFGALPERLLDEPEFADARAATFPAPTPAPIVLQHAGERDRALALAYWPTVDNKDRTLVRQLMLAKEVLQLKLTDRVREADGATYSPSAFATFSNVSPGYGYVGVALDIEPELVDGYYETVDSIVAAMAAGEVSDDEINRARAPILADIEQSLESNGYWSNLASTAQTETLYLDDHRTRRDGYLAVTREEVIAAAQRFLVPSQAYRISILPGPNATASSGAQQDGG